MCVAHDRDNIESMPEPIRRAAPRSPGLGDRLRIPENFGSASESTHWAAGADKPFVRALAHNRSLGQTDRPEARGRGAAERATQRRNTLARDLAEVRAPTNARVEPPPEPIGIHRAWYTAFNPSVQRVRARRPSGARARSRQSSGASTPRERTPEPSTARALYMMCARLAHEHTLEWLRRCDRRRGRRPIFRATRLRSTHHSRAAGGEADGAADWPDKTPAAAMSLRHRRPFRQMVMRSRIGQPISLFLASV